MCGYAHECSIANPSHSIFWHVCDIKYHVHVLCIRHSRVVPSFPTCACRTFLESQNFKLFLANAKKTRFRQRGQTSTVEQVVTAEPLTFS